ncbi:MAG: cytochrome b/b6 domain-containing protein [Burkholderiaceae bacterium]
MTRAATVLVWPAWQRLVHWALAASVLVALVTHEGGVVHEASGYAALALALARIGLGLAGPRAVRFASFVRGIDATLTYARAALAGSAPRHLNHNPLGAWMVLALLSLTALAAASGALYVTDRFWGAAWVIALHGAASWSFAVLVPLHIAGAIVTGHHERENLVAAMVHGHKRGLED